MRRQIYLAALRFAGYDVAGIQREMMERQSWSTERLSDFQTERLRALLRSITGQSGFYAERLPRESSRDPEHPLGDVPVLTKSDLRGLLWKEASARTRRGDVVKTTGGSTGQPVRVIKDRTGLERELGAAWRGYSWHGIAVGDRQARFWRMPTAPGDQFKARLTDWVSNRIRFSSGNVTRQTWPKYFRELQRLRPDYLYGYATMLQDFSRFILKSEQTLEPAPKVVIATAEALPAAGRELITRAFQTAARSEYGCGEVGVIAMECERGSRHINSDNLYLEVLRTDGSINSTGTGKLLVTDLWNSRMPLIRYEVGDVVEILDIACPCGRPFPVLSNVLGRAYDALRTPDGRVFYGSFVTSLFATFENTAVSIDGYQVEQLSPSKIAVRVVTENDNRVSIRNRVEEYFRSQFDPSVEIQMEWPAEIQREASGKWRVVKGLPVS